MSEIRTSRLESDTGPQATGGTQVRSLGLNSKLLSNTGHYL